MREEVCEGEDDRAGFLHAQDTHERPFAVELEDGLRGIDALGGDDVLAGVVAFRGAVPEEETVEESWEMLDEVVEGLGRRTNGSCLAGGAVFALADLGVVVSCVSHERGSRAP